MFRILWLPSYVRTLQVGREYSAEQIREAGRNPNSMLKLGEIEKVSSSPIKKKGRVNASS